MRGMKSSSLIRNVISAASGAAAAQAVIFAFSPLITRIYSPESFGLQGIFLSLISILSPAIALRYPMAIVLADSDAEARALSRLAILIAFILSTLLGIILLSGQEAVLAMTGTEALGSLILFLPLALFCVAIQDVADFRAVRRNSFQLVGVVSVAQAFLSNSARVLGGLVVQSALILVAVTSLAPAVQATLLTLGNRNRNRSESLFREKSTDLMRRYRDFPLYRVPTDVLNAASQSVPVILLAALFSPAAAGLYALTRTVLNLPSNVIGTAVGNVLYSRFAELARNNQPLLPLLLRATLGLLALVPIIVGLAWFSPSVFAFVFGEEWREAGYYARWMSLWVAMMIVNVPTSRIVPVIRCQKLSLMFNVVLLAVRVASVSIAANHSEDAIFAVQCFSICSVLMIVSSILMFSECVRRFDNIQRAKESHDD